MFLQTKPRTDWRVVDLAVMTDAAFNLMRRECPIIAVYTNPLPVGDGAAPARSTPRLMELSNG